MKKTSATAVMAAVLLAAASCSVKEDRTPCPCWLGIDVSGCDAGSVTVSAWNDGHIFSDRIAVRDYPDCYEKAVPKGYVKTSVTAGEKNMKRDSYRLEIPLGQDADSIWAHSADLACFGEFARDTAVMHKQFARVFLKMEGRTAEGGECRLAVSGGISGMDLRDLSPVEGAFRTEVVPDRDGEAMFCLPRQHEDSRLTMDLIRGGKLEDTFPLSRWILETGYNWNAKDLADIRIGVDYARARITVKVEGWHEGGSIIIEF